MAASLDPKELLLRNKLLVIGYVLALVPIPLWFVLVAGGVKGPSSAGRAEKPEDSYNAAKRALNRASGKLKDFHQRTQEGAEQPLRTQEDVTRFEATKALYQKELAALAALVNEKDAGLERWFEAFSGTKPGELPNAADYTTEYNKQIGLLSEEFKDICGQGAESMLFGEPPSGRDLLQGQKRFWVQRTCLEAIKDGGGPKAKLASKIEFPPPPAAAAKDSRFEVIPVRLTLSVPLARVPAVVRSMLARPVPLRVTGVRVEPLAWLYEDAKRQFSVDGRDLVFLQSVYSARFDDQAQFGSLEGWIPEPPIKLELTLEALDFKRVEVEAPPAADAGEGGDGSGGDGSGGE